MSKPFRLEQHKDTLDLCVWSGGKYVIWAEEVASRSGKKSPWEYEDETYPDREALRELEKAEILAVARDVEGNPRKDLELLNL